MYKLFVSTFVFVFALAFPYFSFANPPAASSTIKFQCKIPAVKALKKGIAEAVKSHFSAAPHAELQNIKGSVKLKRVSKAPPLALSGAAALAPATLTFGGDSGILPTLDGTLAFDQECTETYNITISISGTKADGSKVVETIDVPGVALTGTYF